MKKSVCLAIGALVFGGLTAVPAAGQEGARPYSHVISANPFGLLLEFFNAEYERVGTESTTFGFGGSFGQSEGEDEFGATQEDTWFNADVFWRFYPSGEHFEGWNFGVKAGVTRQDSGTYPGLGFDANRSWLLGRNNNFYVGIGFGLKRLFGDIPPEEWEVIPTFRIINVGFAF